jgi:DNA-binding CsgD family transcriptional regulator
MAVTLSTEDLTGLQAATQTLLSPLDYPSVDAWRLSVNAQLRTLLHADSAGFFLPVREGLLLYSDEHDPCALARYPDLSPPPTAGGVPIWEKMKRIGVGTLSDVYGEALPAYLGSAYYNEFAGANHAHDTISATLAVPADGIGMASLQFWHGRPDRRVFGDREVALLRLLFPAFQAGVQSYIHWARQPESLLRTLEGLGQPALIADETGRIVHRTPCLEHIRATDPESGRLDRAMETVVSQLCAVARGKTVAEGTRPLSPTKQVRTQTATYKVQGCLSGRAPLGDAPLVIVRLDRASPPQLPVGQLRDRFGLTRRQAEVAVLLARRKTNPEIAGALSISPHTARHHTESVLGKLGIGDRRQVAQVVAEGLEAG